LFQVILVREELVKRGFEVWMDIMGGMDTDLYESMAFGVSNACAMVVFMSQAYQRSENCMSELKYAKTSRISIVTCMIEGGGWRPTESLGIITAGLLWTPLHGSATDVNFGTNLSVLCDRVCEQGAPACIEHAEHAHVDDGADHETRVANVRDELENLRENILQGRDEGGACERAGRYFLGVVRLF
jgi:hypothetical protein